MADERPAPDDADDEADEPGSIRLPVAPDLDEATATALLAEGDLDLIGRLVASSNNALLGTVRQGDLVAPAVYKPVRGERPLWDFPDGTLADREVAAFELSRATPWRVVPPTVMRDGPFGTGMVQLWLEPDPRVDRVAMVVDGDERLRAMALFDIVANNADRKVGHLLPMADGHVFGVDHGICFHEEPHLRTVLWRWVGEPIRPDELAVLAALRAALDGPLGRTLARRLTRPELRATIRRIDDLRREGCFPEPDPDRPAVPWPVY